jgi:hypothetical protein
MASDRSVSRADDNAEARAIIEKAIRSVGGGERLARYRGQMWKEKATYFGGDTIQQYEATYAARWPDKLRVGIQQEFTLVIDGATGWERSEGQARALSSQEWEEHKEGTYTVWVMSLLPLRDESFGLKVSGETNVSDRPAIAVAVSRNAHSDLTLYFDKDTGLLVRCDTCFTEAKTGKKINQETTFSRYKDEEASGIRSPTHASIKRNGKRFVEADLEFKHVQTLDDSIFAKP